MLLTIPPAAPARRCWQPCYEPCWLAAPAPLKPAGANSVFQAGWAAAPQQWVEGVSAAEAGLWSQLLSVREAVNATLEKV